MTATPSTCPVTVAQMLTDLAEVTDRGVHSDDGFTSWAEHHRRSRVLVDVVNGLLASRPDAPRHVGVLAENIGEFSALFGAAAIGGFVLVGLNTTRRGAALAADVARGECAVVLTCSASRSLLREGTFGDVPVIDVESDHWRSLLADADATHDRDQPLPTAAADDLLMLIFTSGTTGDPKAVRCTHRTFAASGTMLAERFGIGPDDVAYLSMPMFHSNALIAGWAVAVAGGASIVLRRRFSARGFLDDVRRHGVTYANYVGKPLHYILATERHDADAETPLRIMYGNEATAADRQAFAERFGAQVIDGFGSTEGGVAITRTPDTPDDALGPLRRPTAVVDVDTGEVLAPGMIGEIVNLSGAGLFNGYHNDPEATAQRMRGGIYHSGDLGWVDAAGYVYFAGRLGDWVRVDGENLGTAPIERILLRHQAITAAAVFGVPAEVGDEVVAALVVDERRAGTGLSGTDLFDFLAAQQDLGPKQWPHRVVLVDALPQTATFKTVRRELAALAEIPTWVRTPTGYRAP